MTTTSGNHLTTPLTPADVKSGTISKRLSSTLLIHALMIFNILLASSSFPVGAAITNALPPDVMMLIRFFFAAAFFAPYVFIKNGFKLPDVKQLLTYSLLSIPLVTFFCFMFESLRYTSSINTGALYTTVPAITALFALWINKEGVSMQRAISLLIGTLGALWIVFRGDIEAVLALKLNYGDFVFVLGCISLSLYTPLIKRVYRNEPMEVMTFWVILLGAGWLLLLSAHKLPEIEWHAVEPKIFAGVIYLSLFTTLATFFLLQLCTVKIGATKVAAYGFLTPLFVIFLSVTSGESQFELALIPGMILVVVAMLFIQKEKSN